MSSSFGSLTVIKRTGQDGSRIAITSSPLQLGRHPDCEIRCQLPGVAEQHAKVFVENEKVGHDIMTIVLHEWRIGAEERAGNLNQ
jgi:hypothetical protein